MKLYRVHTKSFTAFVVAKNSLLAENEFKQWLDSEDYGYSSDRVITRIELLADTNSKPNSILYPTELLVGAVMEEK